MDFYIVCVSSKMTIRYNDSFSEQYLHRSFEAIGGYVEDVTYNVPVKV